MKALLDQFRKTNRLTFRGIAAKCGFRSAASVLQHCRGTREISAEAALKYHRGLGIPLSDLRPDLWPVNNQTDTPPPAPKEG